MLRWSQLNYKLHLYTEYNASISALFPLVIYKLSAPVDPVASIWAYPLGPCPGAQVLKWARIQSVLYAQARGQGLWGPGMLGCIGPSWVLVYFCKVAHNCAYLGTTEHRAP